ncbi:MAG: MCP four helix bundle domain-containing protein, partial [Thermodesulfobacteriota bacterium]
MKWFFKDIDISRKFAIVFLILLFMLGLGGVVGLYNATQIFKVTERLYLDSFKRLESLSALEGELLSSRQEIFLYSMVRDPSTRSFLEIRIFERKKNMMSLLNDYNSLGLSPEDRALYELMLKDLDNFWKVHISVFSLAHAGERDKAISIIQMEGNKTFTTVMSTLQTLVGMSRGGALSSYERSGFFSRVILAITLAVTLSSITLAIGLWLALRRSIVAPILAIERSASSIASGDFTGRVPVMNNDEIGSL